MIKIRALNRDSLSDEDAPTIRREAQEEIVLDMYNKSLREQCQGNLDEALNLLEKLLTENIPQLESNGGLPTTMSTLKYSCYYNMGNINIQKKNDSSALNHFLKAAELDSSDVTLWHKIGTIALKLDKYRQAAYAFLRGLECNESHWPCLDKLISVLYAIQDTASCLLYIGKALILDTAYTKGHVLRKFIFESNPAAKSYYQAYNPDYILEPDFDTYVSEDDKKKVLGDVEPLCQRLNDVEKSLRPKALPSIGLPTPLQDFTWLSLGKTILNLHKYITENKLSYFSKVDLTKYMSREYTTTDNNETSQTENSQEIARENALEPKTNSLQNEIQAMEVENVVSDDNVERRPSLSSENNNLSEPNCSQGEDNDEMDQDTEDQEDNSEQKEDKKRSTKRKRDLLSDLQIWGWHSKRKYAKKGKSDKDLTIQDALLRIIPSYLIPNGINIEKSKNFEKYKGVDNVFASLKSQLPTTSSNIEKYFGTENEKNDVTIFWTKERDHLDVVDLIEEYTIALAKMWSKKWPKELIVTYLEAYEKYREHFEHPQLFTGLSSSEEIKNDALVTLMYGEIVYFYYLKTEEQDKRRVHPTSLIHLQMLSTWKEQWQDDYLPLFVRIHWLRAYALKELSNHSLAISAYQLIDEAITEEDANTEYTLVLPNCTNFNVITKELVFKLLNHLGIIESLSRVQLLYEKQQYRDVINILIPTFDCGSNAPTWGKMGRPAQLGFLLHSFWFIDKTECFVWTEKCLAEAIDHFINPTTYEEKWKMLLCKCIAILHEIIKDETITVVDSLSQENRIRLVENLCKIVSLQLNVDSRSSIPLGTVTPWLVLHYLLLREEHRQQAKRFTKHAKKDKRLSDKSKELSEPNNDEIPPSIAILFSAHEFLGHKGWCLTGEGELLHFLIDKILDRLDTPIFEPLRDKIDIHLEQAFFCLYQHPSKKNKVSRHLADHSVNPLKLSWERAQQLYEFFCPEALPEFESFKSISISSDLEQLLQRITALVPTQYDPLPLVPKIKEFICGKADCLPEPIDFPIKTRAIYYLLGDYYFKQSEVERSLKFFLHDLCCNPLRLDSWANMALGLANKLENKLNHCEHFNNEEEFNKEAKSAQACFKQALALADNHITLWIEFGSFEYAVHSYYSRMLKYESDTISMEKFERLENQKEQYLDSSGKSFKKALDLHQLEQVVQDERWLHHYMLGKVAEKRRMEPAEYLQHYLTALELLQENNACYPDKINYNCPQHLAIEVLEIHYRVYAAIIKYLELHEGKNVPVAVGKMFKKCLERCAFPKNNYTMPVVDKEPVSEVPSVSGKLVESETTEKDIKTEFVPEITQLEQEEKEFDIRKTPNEMKEVVTKENNNSNDDVKDVIMISDSDDERSSVKAKQQLNEEGVSSSQQLKSIKSDMLVEEVIIKTVREEAPVEIDSDTANLEAEFSNFLENTKNEIQIEIDKCIKEEQEEKPRDNENPETNVEIVEKKIVAPESSEPKIKKEEEEKTIRKSIDDATTTCSSSTDSSSSDSDSDDSSSTTSTATSSDVPTGFLNNSEIDNLINSCIAGLEQCVVRFTPNYKALYRLTHVYFHYKSKKDLSKCRQLLLGQYRCRNDALISGLFSDRKNINFFNGVWRIPSGEIDRPGSLAAHMVRCVTILLQILRNTNDHKSLFDVSLQLKRKPDQDKIYVKESDRTQLADHAMFLCMQSLRTQVKNINNMSNSAAQKFLLDLYRAYQRVQKYVKEKEFEFSSMLEEVYKKFMKEKLPENVNALDLAVKFCQHKAAEKMKIQQRKPPPPVLAAPTVAASAPVHPSPSTITPSMNIPLRRPSIPGRARGRPPGPSKNPGMRKSSPRGRNRNPYNPFSSYQNPMFDSKSLNFAIQYQELLRQYTQLTQMNQMTNSPNSLMTSNLIQMFAQLTGNGLNPTLSPNLSNMWGNVTTPVGSTVATSTTMSQGNIGGFHNNPVRSQIKPNTSASLQKSSLLSGEGTHKGAIDSAGKTVMGGVKKILFSSPLGLPSTAPPTTTTTTFKYPSTDVIKVKTKDVTKTTSSTYISKETSHSPKMSTSSGQSESSGSLLGDVTKLTSQLAKDRPSISITPVITATSSPTIVSHSKLPSSPVKTLQEKLADKQKHASAKNISKSFNFENISKIGKLITSSGPVQQLPTFPKESGITVSQVSKAAVTKHSEPKNKHESSIKGSLKDFPAINLNVTHPSQQVRSTTSKPSEIHRKHSSDDDVIIIE